MSADTTRNPSRRATTAWPCLIDGEAIACDGNGLAVFDLLRRALDT